MKVYRYSEARQQLTRLLDEACRLGEVRIRRRDGQEFSLRPLPRGGSPLDVPGVDAAVTTEEIVEIVREGREDDPGWLDEMLDRQGDPRPGER